MEGVEAGERTLPRTVNGTVALVGDDDVEVPGGVFVDAADHSLKESHCDLLLLARYTGSQPVARIHIQNVLDRFQCLFRELLSVH